MTTTLKHCKTCGIVKPLSEYYPHPTTRDRRYPNCKPCHKEGGWEHYRKNKQKYVDSNRRRYHENPDKEKARARQKNYGLSQEQYEQMLKDQDRCCVICAVSFEERTPCVDHDHETEEVRGLLCSPCNRLLGVFEGPTGTKMAEYLEKGGHHEGQ